MKLWLLSRTDRVYFEEFDSFVVLAKNEVEARKLAAAFDPKSSYDPRKHDWTESKYVKCEQVSLRTAKAQVLLASYNGG